MLLRPGFEGRLDVLMGAIINLSLLLVSSLPSFGNMPVLLRLRDAVGVRGYGRLPVVVLGEGEGDMSSSPA